MQVDFIEIQPGMKLHVAWRDSGVLNVEQLQTFTCGREQLLKISIRFFTLSEKQVTEIAAQTANPTLVRDQCHQLAGGANLIGAKLLADNCDVLHALATLNADEEQLVFYADKLTRSFDTTKKAYSQLFKYMF